MALATRIILALCLAVLAQGTPLNQQPPLVRLAQANNHLAVNLLQTFSHDGSNVFYSPFSIFTALSMVYAGAGGDTAKEMRSALGHEASNLNDDLLKEAFRNVFLALDNNPYDFTLDVANGALLHKQANILDSYKQVLEEVYKAEIDEVDFVNDGVKIVNEVNRWVQDKTHGKIETLLNEPLDPLTRLFLLNAVYFKGNWQTRFEKKNTFENIFRNHGLTATKVPMMFLRSKFNSTFDADLDANVLDLPYQDYAVSMTILLPRQMSDIENLKSKLTPEKLSSVLENLKEREVEVKLPKFKLETKYSLNENLQKLGMNQVFSSTADLSNINGGRDLYVSEVMHKAVVEVNEEGSEAAAVTGAIIQTRSGIIRPKFTADHPFLFLIRHVPTGGILFMGQVNQL